MKDLVKTSDDRENRPAFRDHLIREKGNMHQNYFSRIIDNSHIYLSDIVEKGKYNRCFVFFENIFETLNFDLNGLTMVKIGIHLQVRKSSLSMIFCFGKNTKKTMEILTYLKKSPPFRHLWTAYTSKTIDSRRHWIFSSIPFTLLRFPV